MDTDWLKPHTRRIRELNDKATQVLLFLSFAMVAAVTLRPTLTDRQEVAATCAMRWWTGAVFPALVCLLPVKELRPATVGWLTLVRRLKSVLLWLALACLGIGAAWFFRAL
jgi:hypothetical protein